MSQLSSLCKLSESGPLSESVKDDPTEEAMDFAQFCHFWRSDRVAEKVGGLRNSGVLGFIEMGAFETKQHEKGLLAMERWRILDADVAKRGEARAKLARFIYLQP